MIHIAICDDNKPMLDYLTRRINEVFADNEIKCDVRSFTSGSDFIACHEKSPFDIAFLDIIMPELNGFDVAKQIRKIASNTYIIFVTTESTLVYDSFDFQPFYFIPKDKPQVLEQRLKHVVEKLAIIIAANEKILISGSGETERYLSPDKILYIKSSSNQIKIHLTSGDTIVIRKKLSNFFETLNQYVFARTHNRIVVNMKHIERIDYPNMEVLLNNHEIVEISRGHKESFSNAYLRYTRNFM